MKRGQVTQLGTVFIGALIAVILLATVLMPYLNTVLAGNGTCQPGATCAWNQSGYGSALAISQQVPILLWLALFVSVAIIVIKFTGAM